jgi:hypothetical protein
VNAAPNAQVSTGRPGNMRNLEVPSDIRATLNRVEASIRILVDLNLAQRIINLERQVENLINQIKEGKS